MERDQGNHHGVQAETIDPETAAARDRLRQDIRAVVGRATRPRAASGKGKPGSWLRAAAGAAAADLARAALRRRGTSRPDQAPAVSPSAIAKAGGRAAVAAGVFVVAARREGRRPGLVHALAYAGVSLGATLGTAYLHERIRRSAPPRA
ncbi:MAG TPA: hypothetical protein VKV34_12245 [Thermoleophilia bacterium]|nr:hypothetical protein [Thermoleophilia bacterium]